MFIPNLIPNNSFVELKENYRTDKGTFTKGHRLRVVELTIYDLYELEDCCGRKINLISKEYLRMV